jgi:hypothetical protein
MLGVLVLAGLEARGWGFNVAFLLSFRFFQVLFLCFLFFFCFGVLVYLRAHLRFFNAILFSYLSKKKN